MGILKYGIEFIDIEYQEKNLDFIHNFLNLTKNSRIILSKHFINCDIDYVKMTVYQMNNQKIDILKVHLNKLR